MLFKNKRGLGFSLIELLLVLGITSLAFIGILNYEKKKAEIEDATNYGAKYVEIGTALSNYIGRNSGPIKTILVAAGQESVALNITLLTQAAGNTSGYPNLPLLPATYNNAGPFGSTIQIYLRRETVGTGDVIRGLVISNGPITDATGTVRNDYNGAMVKKMGPQGGMIFPVANTMSGLTGSWTLTNANFTQITNVGKVAYRVQFQGNGLDDALYLKLDGSSTMVGDLNMGNFSLTNATDITYNGWLYGNNAYFNNVISGNITNSGNIATRTIVGDTTPSHAVEALVVGVAEPYANFNTLFTNCINCGFNGVAKALPANFNAANGDIQIGSTGGGTANQGTLFVKDVVLGNGASHGPYGNANLSDRLSRYADRGVIAVVNGSVVPKPLVRGPGTWLAGYACNWTGVPPAPIPKIIITPRTSVMQGGVNGPISVQATSGPVLPPGYYISQDQYALSTYNQSATTVGANWVVSITTPAFTPVGGDQALAHIYCDYGI